MENDIIGQRFGMLTVLSEEPPIPNSYGCMQRSFMCKCDCGGEKLFHLCTLMAHRVKSCGCTTFSKPPKMDLTGQKFRMLTVISEADPRCKQNGSKIRYWNCLCDCGKTTVVSQSNLINPSGTKSCGCLRHAHKRPKKTPQKPHAKNLSGNRYGKLTVISRAEDIIRKDGTHRYTWLCRCDCGNEVIKTEDNLLSGHTRSCGCIRGTKKVGRKFGMLTVISQFPKRGAIKYWTCKCDCGNEIIASRLDLDWGTIKDCGCRKKNELISVGQRFSKLTALREVEPIISPGGKSQRAWLCRCDCGREGVVRQRNLLEKVTRSCGCLRHKKRRAREK